MGKEKSNINLQYDKQAENIDRQNQWQTEENERDFMRQQELWYKQFEAQNQEWQRQFDLQNAYNLPTAQVARMLSAGINPSVAGVDGAGGSTAALSPGSPGNGPSRSVSPMGLSSPNVATTSTAAMFSSLAQLNDSLAQLAKSGSDVSIDQRKVGSLISNTVADTQLKQSQRVMHDLDNQLTKAFGKDKRAAEISSLVSSSYAAYAQGDLNKANELLAGAHERLTSLEGEIKSGAFADILSSYKRLNELYKAETEQQRASASASRSQVEVNKQQVSYLEALTKTADDLREGQVTAQKFSNDLLEISRAMRRRENVRDSATTQEKVGLVFEQLENARLINREMGEKIRMAIQENDWYAVSKMTEIVGDFVGMRSSIIGSNAQSLDAMSRSIDATSRSQLNDALEQVYRDRHDDHMRSIYGY